MIGYDGKSIIVPVKTELQHVHNPKENKHYILMLIADMDGHNFVIGMDKKMAKDLIDGLNKLCDSIH